MKKLNSVLALTLIVMLLAQSPVKAMNTEEQNSGAICDGHNHEYSVVIETAEDEPESASVSADYCGCGGTIYKTSAVLREEKSVNVITCTYKFCPNWGSEGVRLAEKIVYNLYSYSFCASCNSIFYKQFIGTETTYECLAGGGYFFI